MSGNDARYERIAYLHDRVLANRLLLSELEGNRAALLTTLDEIDRHESGSPGTAIYGVIPVLVRYAVHAIDHNLDRAGYADCTATFLAELLDQIGLLVEQCRDTEGR